VIASIPSPSSGVLELGPLSLRAYGLCIALGALAAVKVAAMRQDRRGGPPGLVESIAWWAVPAGLVGARLYHVATDWNRGEPSFADEPLRIVRIWEGGLGIMGGVALGAAVGCYVAARRGARPLRLLDVAAPAIPLAQAIGRFGNWFNQELFGRPTDLPWGLEIDPDNRPPPYEASETFHPTFLYEALWCVAIAGLLLLLERRKRLKPGQLFALYIALYTAGRLAVETLRIDDAAEVGGFRVNELVAPAIGALALLAFLLLGRRDEPALTAQELEADAAARAERTAGEGRVDAAGNEKPLVESEMESGTDGAALEAAGRDEAVEGELADARPADPAPGHTRLDEPRPPPEA
jgi:prolipoprotein diacylglyceryl transferase